MTKKRRRIVMIAGIFIMLTIICCSMLMLKGRVYASENKNEKENEETEYATVTYAVPKAVGNGAKHKHQYRKTNLSAKNKSVGKISSCDGTIYAWLYNKNSDKKPVWKCKVTFDSKGRWIYNSWVIDKRKNAYVSEDDLTGKGNFDLQQIFEKNCDFENGRIDKNAQNRYLVVKFSKGTYDVNDYFRLYSNTKIYGECESGMNIADKVVFNKKNNKVVFLTFDDRSSAIKGYNGFKNIEIANLTINCSDGNQYYQANVMNAAHGRNLKVSNIIVKNGLSGHTFQLTGMEDVRISNCVFEDLNYINFKGRYIKFSDEYASEKKFKEVKNGHNKTNVMFTKEVIQIETDYSDVGNSRKDKCRYTYACPTCKMSNDNTVCNNITISGCKFVNVIRAIGNHTSRGKGYYETNVTIKNNVFNKVTGYALMLIRFKNVSIYGNRFSGISNNSIGGCIAYVFYSCDDDGKDYRFLSPADKWRDSNMYLRNGRYVKMSNLSEKRQFIISR